MYRCIADDEGFVDETVAVPMLFLILNLRKTDCPAHEAPQGIRLRKRLAVELVNPLCRTIGRDDHEGTMLVVSLSHGWSEVEQGSATSDTDHHRLMECLYHAKGIEARTALISDGIALYVGTLIQIVHDGGIATARAHDGMMYAVSHQQRREYVYVLLVTIHKYLNS